MEFARIRRSVLAAAALAASLALALAQHAAAQQPTMAGIFNGSFTVFPVRTADCGASGVACDPVAGRQWEGLASTDYFTTSGSSPPNPDIAVGPDDILTVAGRTIARYPNPNAPLSSNGGGTASVPYNPPGTLSLPPTSRIDFDTWLGEAALNELCPTFPRTSQSCVIDNASVRYDQMQGRFVVLFTVVDTGHVQTSGGLGTPSAISGVLRRKASWVLVVSRWAALCQGFIGVTGVNVAVTGCTTNTTPADTGEIGNAEVFTTPQVPGPNQANANSGGANANWIAYFGGNDGTCDAACAFGNINSISDLRRGGVAPGSARTVDCNNTAVGDTTRVCYLPVSARLGIDSDNLVIVSTVHDDNVPLAVRTLANPAYQGTRIRVLKKAAFYNGLTSTPPGSGSGMTPGAAQAGPPLQGDFYDLYSVSSAFTIERTAIGLNYEPAHLRGRPLATFSGNANLDNGYTSLVGTVAAQPGGLAQSSLRVQHIAFTRTDVVEPAPPTLTRPLIQGGIPSLAPLLSVNVAAFTNPNSVVQRFKLTQPSPNNQLNTPLLYVGDNRPHRVIAREGHLTIARVVQLPNAFNLDGQAQTSTVAYDALQALSRTAPPLPVFNLAWQNGRFFAPMFDVPAYVSASTAPLLALPQKSVSTAFPPLAPTDPRIFSYGNLFGHALVACKGNEPTASTSLAAYPGLFDMRCGEDAFDTAQAFRHPVAGSFTPTDFQLTVQPAVFPNQIVPFGLRGGAANDPINLGTWVYGAYAKGRRASVGGYGQWGTFVAQYPATIPATDLGGVPIPEYTDVPRSHPLFTSITIGRLMGVDPQSPAAQVPFNPGAPVSRGDMAKWTILGMMDETAITAFLNATGGIQCNFGDVSCPGSIGGTVTDTTGRSGNWRYIEAMFRKRITSGCQGPPTRLFCPTSTLTRGEMAVFLVRAKMGNVFPLGSTGVVATSSCTPPGTTVTHLAHAFGLYNGCVPQFSDVPNTHPFFAYIQKLAELRITSGVTLPTPTTLGTYGPSDTLTRQQLMVFIVRAFFS
jgi:hypothetical protein